MRSSVSAQSFADKADQDLDMLMVRPGGNTLGGLLLPGIGHDLEEPVQEAVQKHDGPFPGQVRGQFIVGQTLINQTGQIRPGSGSDFTEISGPTGQVFISQDMHIHPVQAGMVTDKGQAGVDNSGETEKEILVPGVLPDVTQMVGDNVLGLGKDIIKKPLFRAKILKYRTFSDSKAIDQAIDAGLMVAIHAEFGYGRIQDGLLLFRGYLEKGGAWITVHSAFGHIDPGRNVRSVMTMRSLLKCHAGQGLSRCGFERQKIGGTEIAHLLLDFCRCFVLTDWSMVAPNNLPTETRVRKNLSADALYTSVRNYFDYVPDYRCQKDIQISQISYLLGGFEYESHSIQRKPQKKVEHSNTA